MNSNATGKDKRISTQLLVILVPMIAAFIIIVAAVLFITSQGIIIREAENGLKNESKANANDISATMDKIRGYLNGVGDSLENSEYSDDKVILNDLTVAMEEYGDMVSDVYLALNDGAFIDASLWVPDEDYDPTTRAWYQNGSKSDSIVLGAPSIDLGTMKMVVCGSRSISLLDGRSGVMSADIQLDSISSAVKGYTPSGTGESMLLSGSVIVASTNDSYVGTDVSEHTDDAFLQAIYSSSQGNTDKVLTLKGSGGKQYLVSLDKVNDTDWTLASYVKRDDVLRDLNALSIVTIILVIAMLIGSTLIIMFLVKKMITAPITALTETIMRIADGDFTVNITKGGNNEIGTMNNRMHDYVERMRGTLGEMKQVTQNLSVEADSSRSAAESMSSQADSQSQSMDQIHVAMEGVAHSVTELATNATELAQSVSEMSEQGATTREIMGDLLEKAKKGQQDMANVQNNMTTISGSMAEMNEVVQSVEEAANKINSIIGMINSISSQTNLLSLNASIEAARAGEAGKGFAVVATEIGSLANDSAQATTDISKIIVDITTQIKTLSARAETSVKDIAVSSEAVSVTGETFAQIFESLDTAGTTVNDMVSKMDKVNEIATSVAAIAEEQSASTEEVTATVESAASSAQNVADESRNVDASAVTVAESSARIGEFVDTWTI